MQKAGQKNEKKNNFVLNKYESLTHVSISISFYQRPDFFPRCTQPKDNKYIDMQTGINLEVLRKCANSTISVVRMAFYPLDCC